MPITFPIVDRRRSMVDGNSLNRPASRPYLSTLFSSKSGLAAALWICLALPAVAGSLYPMECGDLRRENHSLSPSPLQNPIQVQWVAQPCLGLKDPISNPIILSDRVIQTFFGGLRCYDRSTGSHLWTWRCDNQTSLWNPPTYDASRNLLYQGCYNGDTLALDPSTGNVVWSYPHQPASYPGQYSGPLYAQGNLYVGNGGAGFLCLNPDTRAVNWTFDFSAYFGAPFRDATCTPAYDNGFIYLALSNGDLFCLNATTGAVQWHVKQDFIRVTCPLLTDDSVYTVGKLGQVECRSRVDGSLTWKADTHTVFGNTNGNLAICGDVLIVPGDSWRVWGLDRKTGAKIWCTLLTGNFALNSPIVVCGKVYISACHGDFYSLDGRTGQIEWRLYHGIEYTFIGWGEADGQLFACLRNQKMICFNSVTPGDPANCAVSLSSTPLAGYSPSPTPTALFGVPNPNCPPTATQTPTHTPTATFTRTGTLPPTATFTPTPTGTWYSPTPTNTLPYDPTRWANTDTSVAQAMGVPVSIVDEARQLNLDPLTTYIILVIMHHCGCHPHEVWMMMVNLTWDEICAYYGLTYQGVLNEEASLTSGLLPEGTATATPVSTVSPSATPTVSGTVSPANTGTATNTATSTATSTATNTATVTFTATPTSTATHTPTLTATLTSTNTATLTATSTPTGTPTYTPTRTPEQHCHPVGYPNPSRGEPINFNVGGGPYDDIEVNVYTTSERRICHQKHDCHGLEEEDLHWDLRDGDGGLAANGLYYVVIETHKDGMVQKYCDKVLILR
ncbi:MAG TPA: PQQ-binding-like beta-propeller repeat protein [bacterium]|nr:PQQ-binding-like beta-propeller repeat protein [bacterium]